MVKSLIPVFMTSAGVAAAGVAGIVVVNLQDDPVPPKIQDEKAAIEKVVEQPQEQSKEKPAEIATLAEPQAEPEEPAREQEVPKKIELPKPEFSVLTIDPDGTGVVAGSGAPFNDLQLFDGETLIAESKTGPVGDFVIVLDKPLAPGPHQLTLRTIGPKGEVAVSDEAGLVNIPSPDAPSELAILISKPGEASKILTQPTTPEVAEPKEVKELPKAEESPKAEEPKEVEVAKVDPQLEVTTETENVVVKVEEPKEEPGPQVLIQAVETEGDQIFIAGTAAPGAVVNLYMGSDYLGQTTVAENGAYLFEGIKRVEAGRHEVRADMIAKGSADVVSRAAVDLVHEPEVIAEVKQPEIEPEEVASSPTEQAEEEEPLIVASSSPEVPAEEVKQPQAIVQAEPVAEAEAPQQTEAEAEPETAEQPEIVRPEIRTGSAVIIRRGDSLWRVAHRNYGAGVRYTTIFDANRDQVKNPDLIYPGQILKVPEKDESAGTDSSG